MNDPLNNKNENTNHVSFPLWRIFPSMITLFALCLGLNSIRLTFNSKWEMSLFSIIGAAFLDGVDGRIARLLGCSSMFGAQLDSLADFLNFGVAPALLIYFIFLIKIKILGWSLVTIFVICVAIRLARFNTSITYNYSNSWRANFFYGVPAPAAAILLLLPAMLSFKEIYYSEKIITENYYIIGYIFLVSCLTVSHIPTLSLKKVHIHKRFISPLLLFFGIMVISIILKPWVALPALSLVYIMSIPFSMAYYYYLEYKEQRSNS